MSSMAMRQVESLLDELSVSEQAELIEQLARRIRLAASPVNAQPQDLYGAWKDKFPEDVELDTVLREIRQEWKTELGEEDEFTE
jgi:hypothetical protein